MRIDSIRRSVEGLNSFECEFRLRFVTGEGFGSRCLSSFEWKVPCSLSSCRRNDFVRISRSCLDSRGFKGRGWLIFHTWAWEDTERDSSFDVDWSIVLVGLRSPHPPRRSR